MEYQNNYPRFWSEIFHQEFNSVNIDELELRDLVVLQDEVENCLNEYKKLYRNLSKNEKIAGTDPIIQQYSEAKIFQVGLKRRVFFVTKSVVAGLKKSKENWKKRALVLGSQLGMTKTEVKQLIPE